MEGDSLMLEWSKPLVVMVTKTLNHLRSQYKFFADSSSESHRGGVVSAQKGGGVKEESSSVRYLSLAPPGLDVSLDFSFRLANTNVFVFGLAPGKQHCQCVCVWLHLPPVCEAFSNNYAHMYGSSPTSVH